MKKLLILEDDATYAAGLIRSLSRRDYSCMIASSTESALEIAKSTPLDAILMDLNLGSETTQEAVSPLRKLCPKARIVLLTGFGTIPSAVQAIKDGANSYLTKPATPEAIDYALAEAENPDASAALWDVEKDHISQVLSECGGNITQAAKKLGLHRRTLQRRLKKS